MIRHISIVMLAALTFFCPRAGAEDFTEVVQKAIKEGRLAVEPHKFSKQGILIGGVRRGFGDDFPPYLIAVDTLSLLEAKCEGLTKRQCDEFTNGCSKQIKEAVKGQLVLINNAKLDPEELANKLREQQEKATQAVFSSAKALGYKESFELKLLNVEFELTPAEGGTAYFAAAGDLDVYQYFKEQGAKVKEPWTPAGNPQSMGKNCFYKVYAAWADGKSKVMDVRVTTDGQKIRLKKE